MDVDYYGIEPIESDEELRTRLLRVAPPLELARIYRLSGHELDAAAKQYGLVRDGGAPVLVI